MNPRPPEFESDTFYMWPPKQLAKVSECFLCEDFCWVTLCEKRSLKKTGKKNPSALKGYVSFSLSFLFLAPSDQMDYYLGSAGDLSSYQLYGMTQK